MTITSGQTVKKRLYDSKSFEKKYHYDGPLGARCGDGGTVFTLWAPTARAVVLRLYRDGGQDTETAHHPLAALPRGVWEYRSPQNLDGWYYDYLVTDAEGTTRRTADPYARACGLNGARSMVLDLARTDPAGWAEDRPPARGPEDIIYEVHVKDFTWDPASGVRDEWRGKYKGLAQRGTTLAGDGVHPTGLDYLLDLGVTHLQLMPVFDYGSVDEAGPDTAFNWGYDPVNYNVPEGSYATDPAHGEVRIRELKETIQALHRSGLRVIMDVVYNHTYKLDSWLWRTEPWYFYRQMPDGSPSDGSACGNDLATERGMCGRYILDSVLYWAEEYHMDGFRFDLMGLLDTDLMNRIRAALDARFGRGEKLIYGEPWSARRSAMRRGARPADKRGLVVLDSNVGAFCDMTRDLVKGHITRAAQPGFVNGGTATLAELCESVTGCTGGRHGFHAQAPSQTITYLSSHDDWTLWDKLILTMDPTHRFDEPLPQVLRANRLAAAICMTCQGHLFLLSGEEFGRTKQGLRDSFNAPVQLNRIDWRRAWSWRGLGEYYRGLMALRKQLPGLCDKSSRAVERLTQVWRPGRQCAAFLLDNSGGESRWRELMLVYNASGHPRNVVLPGAGWEILADADSSTLWQHPAAVQGAVQVEPTAALILGRI